MTGTHIGIWIVLALWLLTFLYPKSDSYGRALAESLRSMLKYFGVGLVLAFAIAGYVLTLEGWKP